MNVPLVLLLVLAVVAVLVGCATSTRSSDAAAPKTKELASNAPDVHPSPAAVTAGPRAPSSLDLWKQEAARQVVARNRARTFEDVPEHFLRSIVVLRIVVDAQGVVRSVRVDRGNGYRNLEQVAWKAVRDSSPLPPPPSGLVRNGVLEYSESFLFRKDNKFQVRSIALEQPDPTERGTSAAAPAKLVSTAAKPAQAPKQTSTGK